MEKFRSAFYIIRYIIIIIIMFAALVASRRRRRRRRSVDSAATAVIIILRRADCARLPKFGLTIQCFILNNFIIIISLIKSWLFVKRTKKNPILSYT